MGGKSENGKIESLEIYPLPWKSFQFFFSVFLVYLFGVTNFLVSVVKDKIVIILYISTDRTILPATSIHGMSFHGIFLRN